MRAARAAGYSPPKFEGEGGERGQRAPGSTGML